MKNSKIKIVSLILAPAIIATAISASFLGGSIPWKVSAEHQHIGNHYTALLPTEQESGTKEYWVCCGCHQHYLSQPDEGIWTDAGTASQIADSSDDRYIEKLPELYDVKAGWTSSYNTTGNYYEYTNHTSGAISVLENTKISGIGKISYKYYTNGLGYDGATRSNWCAGLMLTTSTDIASNKGPYMVIGKTSGSAKRITSIVVKTSTAWNNPTGTNIIIADDTEYNIDLTYNFETGSISVECEDSTSVFTMPQELKEAGSLYIGFYGSTMTGDNTYGEVKISDIKLTNKLDVVSGWKEVINDSTGLPSYVNNTNRALAVLGNKTISGKGFIKYDYTTTGVSCDENNVVRSDWVPGLVFATSTNIGQTVGQYMVIGKTPMVAKRITSTYTNGTSTNWNNPITGSTNIVMNESETISLLIEYDFEAGTMNVTGKGNTSYFNMPTELKSAGKLYLGLCGAYMKTGYDYGEVKIENLQMLDKIDISSGWTKTITDGNPTYTNTTNGGLSILPEKITGTGSITFDYTNTGLGYNGGAISNWCAGLLLTPSLNIKSNKGPFMVIGKSSANTKRFTSIFTSDASATAWKVPTGDVIAIEDGITYSITLDYDFSTGKIIATCGGKTSTFTLVDELKNAGSLYLGLYGSTMTGSNTYGEVKIANLNVVA